MRQSRDLVQFQIGNDREATRLKERFESRFGRSEEHERWRGCAFGKRRKIRGGPVFRGASTARRNQNKAVRRKSEPRRYTSGRLDVVRHKFDTVFERRCVVFAKRAQIASRGVSVARGPKRIEADATGRCALDRAAKIRVIRREKRIDAVESAEERTRLFRDAFIGEKMANFAPVDRVASRKAEPANGESCKLTSRHQFECRTGVPARHRANRRYE